MSDKISGAQDAPKLLNPEQLAGVYEKLKRADENIVNLNLEISEFLNEGPDRRTADDKRKAVEEWLKFHSQRDIPPRFAVLSGEILYHLRSSLDHIAWLLSTEDYRRTKKTSIAFPILSKPPNEDEQSRYNKQVRGVAAPAARSLIEDLQPYKGEHPIDNPLTIVHKLNRIDKHRNLVLVVATFDAKIDIPKHLLTTRMIGGGLETDKEALAESVRKANFQMSRQVAFAQFGERKNQPVIPSLTELTNAIRNVVKIFAVLS
jgi:Ni,Fe-hydrogenase I large subunit